MSMIEHTFEEQRAEQCGGQRGGLGEAVDLLRGLAETVEPDRHAGADAARLTKIAAEGERLCAYLKVAFARRAEDTRAWRGGRAVSPEQWLAEASGCSEGQARDALTTARRVETLPETRDRLRSGRLSMAQAAQVAAGAAVDPNAEHHLLKAASRSGMRGLRAEKERVVAAATDQEAAARRAHRDRHFRVWNQGAATHGSFAGPTAAVADLLEALQPLTQRRFEEARSAELRESQEAYRFDALCDLARSGGEPTGVRPKHVARVRVDLPALLRGRTEPGETCEIPGVGPVPVSHAREVLSHGLLQLVITDGVDVQTVVSGTRHVPMSLKIAIAERDQRCKVRGCDCTTNLHRHHTEAFARSGRTTYRELGNLCSRHHHLVHDEEYEIVVLDDGSWDPRAPMRREGRAPPGTAAA